MTTLIVRDMSMADASALVAGHLAEHALPEPVSLTLHLTMRPSARVQVPAINDLPRTAGLLLAWAHTLPAVSVRAWYPPTGDRVHLDLDATLTGPTGSIAVTVYGGVPFDPVVFPGLEPDQERPVSLGQLTAWAGGEAV